MSIENSPKWVQEQVRTGLDIKKELDIKKAIDELSTEVLITFFEKNSTAKFSKGDPEAPKNSAAHIIAYQKALNLLGISVGIDGIYGANTRDALIKFQTEQKLQKPNGIPGQKTVEKLIEALKSKLPKKEEPNTPILTEKAKETPEQKVDMYLTKNEGFTVDKDGNYISPDKDFTVTLRDGKAEYTRGIGRVLGNWGFSKKEEEVISKIFNIFKESNK